MQDIWDGYANFTVYPPFKGSINREIIRNNRY
jgi:hypothetical protein